MREHYHIERQYSVIADYIFAVCIGLFFAVFLFFNL